MTKRPTDEELRAMIRTLPHPEPPGGFAEGVMARIRREERRARRRPWVFAVAAAALLAAGALIRYGWDPTPAERDLQAAARGAEAIGPGAAAAVEPPLSPDRREFEAILEEYRLLAEELETMRRFAGEPPFGPLVRIGGSDRLDLFLDLQSYLDAPSGRGGAPVVTPVSDRRR